MAERVRSVDILVFPDGRLDTKNAAAYLGLSEKTLAMMRCQGTGPCFIKRGRVFYYQEDLDAWMAQAKKVTSTAQAKQSLIRQ
jgi:predicted DNA-binding transcriptional regulator AlpA